MSQSHAIPEKRVRSGLTREILSTQARPEGSYCRGAEKHRKVMSRSQLQGRRFVPGFPSRLRKFCDRRNREKKLSAPRCQENQAVPPVGLSRRLFGNTILANRCVPPEDPWDRMRRFCRCWRLTTLQWCRIAHNSRSLLQNVSFIVLVRFSSEVSFQRLSFV